MDFTQEQIKEARDFLLKNLSPWVTDIPTEGKEELIKLYFRLKETTAIQPNEFIVGLDYNDINKVKLTEEAARITFHDPETKLNTDIFARDTLILLLKKLITPK